MIRWLTGEGSWRECVADYGVRGTLAMCWRGLEDVPLAVRLRVRPAQAVLWGGRPGIDRQIGSETDLRLAAFARRIAAIRHARRKQAAGMVHLTMTFRDAFTPAIKAAAEVMQKLGAAMQEEQKRQLKAASALGRALQVPPDERG